MGNCCGCNIANRINGLNIMILCVVVVINFWYEFDSAQGLNCSQYTTKGKETCQAFAGCSWQGTSGTGACMDTENRDEIKSCMKSLDINTCKGRLASGIFATIGALVALFGAISNNPERNESTIAAAFALINLAHAAFLFGEHENPLQKELRSDQYISGVSNLIGALCGIFYAIWSCRSGDQVNNLAKIMATFFYAFSFTVTSWKLFDDSCSANDLKEGDDIAEATQGKALDGDACTMQAFGGVFGLACMLFCIFAAVQVCCKKDLQPKFQSFIICLAYGMIFGYWLSLFWYRFANATQFGEASCNTKDPSKENTGFCFTQFLGGACSLAGMPLAVITGLLFCMGCITPTEDDDEYDSSNPYGV